MYLIKIKEIENKEIFYEDNKITKGHKQLEKVKNSTAGIMKSVIKSLEDPRQRQKSGVISRCQRYSVFYLISDPPEYLSFSSIPQLPVKKMGAGDNPSPKFRCLIILEFLWDTGWHSPMPTRPHYCTPGPGSSSL